MLAFNTSFFAIKKHLKFKRLFCTQMTVLKIFGIQIQLMQRFDRVNSMNTHLRG